MTNLITKDLWKDIFEYLDGEDLLRCSLVCKYFYELNLDNSLWFRKIDQKKLYLKKKISKTHPILFYYSECHYKQYYLSLFHHSYTFELFVPYRNLKSDYEKFIQPDPEWKTKFIFFGLYVPLQVLLFPVYCICEWMDYVQSKKRKIEYCDCKKCYRRQVMTLSKIRK